ERRCDARMDRRAERCHQQRPRGTHPRLRGERRRGDAREPRSIRRGCPGSAAHAPRGRLRVSMSGPSIEQRLARLEATVALLAQREADRDAEDRRAEDALIRESIRKPYGTHWLDLDNADPDDVARWNREVDRATRRRRAA